MQIVEDIPSLEVSCLNLYLKNLYRSTQQLVGLINRKKLFATHKDFLDQTVIEISKEKTKMIICRICDQQLAVDLMVKHCQTCKQKAEQTKKLLQLNIQLADVAEQAYKQKHEIQVTQGIKKMKESRQSRILQGRKISSRTIKRTLSTVICDYIDDEDCSPQQKQLQNLEWANIISAMTLIGTFVEKVINNESTEDTKLNVVTLNELQNAHDSISDEQARKIIDLTSLCVIERIDYMKKLQSLDAKGPENRRDSVEDLRKKFAQSSNAMSFRHSKFQQSPLTQNKMLANTSSRKRGSIFQSESIDEEDEMRTQDTQKGSKMIMSSLQKRSVMQSTLQKGASSQPWLTPSVFAKRNFDSMDSDQSSRVDTIEDITDSQHESIVQESNSSLQFSHQGGNLSQFARSKAKLDLSLTNSSLSDSKEIISRNPALGIKRCESQEQNDPLSIDTPPLQQQTKSTLDRSEKKNKIRLQEITAEESSGTSSSDTDQEYTKTQYTKAPIIAKKVSTGFEYKIISVDRGYNSDSEVASVPLEKQQQQIQVSIADFEFLKPLGQGAFGGVFLVKKKASGDLYAMKLIDCSQRKLESQLATLKAERNIFEILSGDFVVKAYYSFSHEQYLCFVQEYMVGGDFANILKLYTALDEEYVKYYIAQVVLALEYLRKLNVVHRDLKPDNILLDSKGHAKLADFGLSEVGVNNKLKLQLQSKNSQEQDPLESIMGKKVQIGPNFVTEYSLTKSKGEKPPSMNCEIFLERSKRIIGTPDYIAPEFLRGESVTNKSVDYWSLGVIMYEMMIGVPPFNDESVEKIFENIQNMKMDWPPIGYEDDCISPNAYDLISKLLTPDFTKRIGHDDIEDIKNHPFFQGIVWDQLFVGPGMIVPKMIIHENHEEKKQDDLEKVEEFLKTLDNKEHDLKHSILSQKLKSQLQSLERLDLLVQLSQEEATNILNQILPNLRIVQLQQVQLTIQETHLKSVLKLINTKVTEHKENFCIMDH